MVAGQSSGSTSFRPALADLIVESYSRIGYRGSMLQTEHLVEARRSLNLILQDWSGNRGVNLFKVTLDYIPLPPGALSVDLPTDTIQVLDVYTRLFQLSSTTTTLGNTLTAMTANGVPVLTGNGEPMVLAPGSGTLSAVQGSQTVTMHWPSHGQQIGNPISFDIETSIGGLLLFGLYVVDSIIDVNNLTFQANVAASWTSLLQGATPLFATLAASAIVDVILPNHGLNAGDSFSVVAATTVGGITLSGAYTVVTTPTNNDFTIIAAGTASSNAAVFENSGQLQYVGQQTNVDFIDLIMMPISRTEYASIPNKYEQGRPTTFWLDRQINPVMYLWEVPPVPQTGQSNTQPYAAGVWSMKMIEDANPVDGQVPDLPSRFFPALCASLCASLAEKYKPELFMAKLALSEAIWSRASLEDNEQVPLFISPTLSGYWS